MISASHVRRQFLDYFRAQGHTELPSASLVPHGDPTLLLTSAGMVPFKPYFMGEAVPPNRRLTTSQKCFRTVDIDTVGNLRNLTFFEMLGNFSIGDYFKRGAITFAWDLLTNGYGLDKDRLWATVYPSDEETYGLWREIAGLPDERIVKLHENWWGPAGATGPCGPDTEIFLGPRPGLGLRQARTASPAATASATWRSGTWCSCSSTASPTAPTCPCPGPASTPAPAWSA